MTVTRTRHIFSDTAVGPELLEQLVDALRVDRRFGRFEIREDGFLCRYRPLLWPLVLSTELTVRIHGAARARTDIELATASQEFVMGDVFHSYGRLLDRVARKIQAAIPGTSN